MSTTPGLPVETPDPFKGGSPTHEEFSEYRKTGELPARFKEPEVEPPATEKVETVASQEPAETEQEKEERERDEQGKFKAKDKEPLFNDAQQKEFDRAFKKREAKIRREYEDKLAAQTSSNTQGMAPAKEPATAAVSEPQPPDFPDITSWTGTAEEYSAAAKQYPAKLAAFLDAKRAFETAQTTLKQRLDASETKVKEAHADYEEQFKSLIDDIKAGEENPMPQHVLKAIAEDADDPHGVTYYLATHRDEYAKFAALSPQNALREVLKLDLKLSDTKAAPAPVSTPRKTAAPTPPQPVGARASISAFDANDDSIDADAWMRQRNAQRQKAGHKI